MVGDSLSNTMLSYAVGLLIAVSAVSAFPGPMPVPRPGPAPYAMPGPAPGPAPMPQPQPGPDAFFFGDYGYGGYPGYGGGYGCEVGYPPIVDTAYVAPVARIAERPYAEVYEIPYGRSLYG